MPDDIAELLNTPIPDKLWHYTSVIGFQGIVESKKIFATETRFLNDRREFIHARNLANEIVEQTPEVGSNQFPARESLRSAINLTFDVGPLRPDRLQVFVACFSAAGDQLSQWRGYSRGSSGVSLAFDLRKFRPPEEIDTLVSFATCVYDPDRKKALLRHALKHVMEEMQAFWNQNVSTLMEFRSSPVHPEKLEQFTSHTQDLGKRLTEAGNKSRADVLRIAALLKDWSFHEEQEWRLVLPVGASKNDLQNPICFRSGHTTLIPYIAHPFSNDPSATLPLVDWILGPGSDANAVYAAQTFLRSKKIMTIPQESRVPYRHSW